MLSGLPASKFGKGPCFARVRATADALGVDLAALAPRSVLIVGSNGKGTTAAMTAAALATGGRTGLFTSPHLLRIGERIAIDGASIADERMNALSGEVAEARAGAGVPDQSMGAFEHLFLMAALAFQRAECAWIVWEAGIGGRFDPTRLVRARRGALTSLDLEHTDLLGDTLTAIGQDKLDGFASGAEVVVGPSATPVWADLAAFAALTDKTLVAPTASEQAPFMGLEAAFLRIDASLAWALTRRLIGERPEACAAIAGTRLPGRLETVDRAPLTIIDIGHTPEAARHALEGFQKAAGGGGGLMIGVSPQKNAAEILDALAPHFSTIACVRSRFSGRPAEEIETLARRAAPAAAIRAYAGVGEAWSALRAGGQPILVAGSLYVAAEAKALAMGLDPAALGFLDAR
ncbi:MAG: bifunctional folylpolyglutamate synthase/dihydrofolate synthase [Alphaproteobacteria bacterium]|nr:bifunctional folylpolyglutamate synthase/dihydrofolate synthase [Alphaproteobacteria bacterium]